MQLCRYEEFFFFLDKKQSKRRVCQDSQPIKHSENGISDKQIIFCYHDEFKDNTDENTFIIHVN